MCTIEPKYEVIRMQNIHVESMLLVHIILSHSLTISKVILLRSLRTYAYINKLMWLNEKPYLLSIELECLLIFGSLTIQLNDSCCRGQEKV